MTGSKKPDIIWHKSTASGSNGDCVEVAFVDDSVVVRNSREPLGAMLSFTRQEWAAFLEGAGNGEFTLDQISNDTL